MFSTVPWASILSPWGRFVYKAVMLRIAKIVPLGREPITFSSDKKSIMKIKM